MRRLVLKVSVLLLAVSVSHWWSCPTCLWGQDQHTWPAWNQWRGPGRDAIVRGAVWPDCVDESHLTRLWRVELPPSYSGPIVSESLVFTTATADEEREVAYAFDRHSGEKLWEVNWPGAMSVPFFAASNGSWIRATPACDGERLFVAGMRDVLVCLDAQTGQEQWRVDFVEKLGTPVPSFGFASSPLIDGRWLYVQAGASLVKLDKTSGEIAWRVLPEAGGMMDSAFSSPVIATLAGHRQLVVQNAVA